MWELSHGIYIYKKKRENICVLCSPEKKKLETKERPETEDNFPTNLRPLLSRMKVRACPSRASGQPRLRGGAGSFTTWRRLRWRLCWAASRSCCTAGWPRSHPRPCGRAINKLHQGDRTDGKDGRERK